METTELSASIRLYREVLDEWIRDTGTYLSSYSKAEIQGFFSSCSLTQKEIATDYYKYAATVCRHWDRVAEQLVEIGTLMQNADARMDAETVSRCDAIFEQGDQFRDALDVYLTECETILKSERPLPKLYKRTQAFLVAAEQFRSSVAI